MTRRSATKPEVRVGGVWLSSIVPYFWGGLTTSTRPSGDWEASWTIGFERLWRHPALVAGALVEIFLGPVCVFTGTLNEPDWDAGRFVADGAARLPEGAMALDGAGSLTTTPNTAIDAGIARGALAITRAADFGSAPIGDSGGGIVSLRSVLDGAVLLTGEQWRITRQRRLIKYTPTETVPDFYVTPGTGVLGAAGDDRADRVFVRYQADAAGTLATASYPATTPPGGIEKPMSVVDRGVISAAQATAIAQSTWSELRGRNGWTNGIRLRGGQVTTPGGVIVDLGLVRAGHCLRLLGVPDVRGIAAHTDIVIGETSYSWDDDDLQANPVGLVARDVEGLLEQVGTLAVEAMAKASGSYLG